MIGRRLAPVVARGAARTGAAGATCWSYLRTGQVMVPVVEGDMGEKDGGGVVGVGRPWQTRPIAHK